MGYTLISTYNLRSAWQGCLQSPIIRHAEPAVFDDAIGARRVLVFARAACGAGVGETVRRGAAAGGAHERTVLGADVVESAGAAGDGVGGGAVGDGSDDVDGGAQAAAQARA